MKEDLKSLIQQHLPAMAAGEMKTFIEQAEKDRKDIEHFKQAYEKAAVECSSLYSKIEILTKRGQQVEDKAHELDEKEKSLNQKEFNLKVSELTYQLEAEKKSKTDIFQLVSTFVANPRAIEVINRSRTYLTGTDYDSNGRPSHYPTGSHECGTVEFKEEKN